MTPQSRWFPWLGVLGVAAMLLAAGVAGGLWWARHAAPSPAVATASSAVTKPAERTVLYWYDPMEPAQHFEHGGKSPFMDMELVPRYGDEDAAGAAQGLAIAAGTRQSLGLRSAVVERMALAERIEAAGTIELSEREVSIVQSRTAGFVERVSAHAPGDVIAAGSPLADVLNPEWAGAQQEYLAVRGMHDAALTAAARARLVLLGMPETLIGQVETAGHPLPVTTIVAPSGGVITELMVRQGMTLSAGMTLARINGLSTVWLNIAVPEAQAATLAVGQGVQVTLSALPGRTLRGKIATLLPQLDAASRTLRVRVELPNPGNRLRAGMFAQATLQGAATPMLVVPSDAVIRTGRRALVYLAEAEGHYRPVEVEIGVERDGRLEIRSGLQAGQHVVVSGQFLVDSEASLRGIQPESAAALATPATAAGPASTATPAAPAAGVRP